MNSSTFNFRFKEKFFVEGGIEGFLEAIFCEGKGTLPQKVLNLLWIYKSITISLEASRGVALVLNKVIARKICLKFFYIH